MYQPLYKLPWRVASAAENMALDWLMLENFPYPASVRMRFYGWSQPAWTFGYSQKWVEARQTSGTAGELIRRPTGGGLVDHRNDWTYALVFPFAHPLAKDRACASYQMVHEAVAAALNATGVDCRLQLTRCSTSANAFSICFQKPEPNDVVRKDNGRKIAGAAQKRAKVGLLFQGSIDRLACPEICNWNQFGVSFTQSLGKMLNLKPLLYKDALGQPSAVSETVARFNSEAWNQKR